MEITPGMNEKTVGNGPAVTSKKDSKAAAGETAAAKKVAKEFEALFVGMMLKSMRETIGKDELTNGGHGEEVYRSMLDQEYARSLTEHGGVGLTAMLERQLGESASDDARYRGINIYDTAIQTTKIEVNYENR